MKTYAVLHAPEFRLQALLRHSRELTGKAVALTEMQRTKPRICELNAAARAHHVERGMTPTQALARCPNLHLLSGNLGHERSAQEVMIQLAENLSPNLESTLPGIVTVELPPERVFREEDFREKIVAPLEALCLDVRVGMAGTPDLALLAARHARPIKIVSEASEFLAPLSVSALQPNDELAAVLDSWGIRTIGEFVALPSAHVWERLGPEAIHLWELATGGRPRPLKLIQAAEFFREEMDLENAVTMLEPLLFLLRRFLEQITTRLEKAYLVAGRLRLTLRFDNGASYQRIFSIPQPTRDVTLLFRMIHTHLENFSSESPIVGLELAAKPTRPGAEQFDLLERGLRDPHQFSETLARLQALLGTGEVGSAEVEPSHHPDAYHLRNFDPQAPAPKKDEVMVGIPWLCFSPPEPARVILNDTRPAYLYSSRATGPIRDSRGPWFRDGHWWEDRQDWGREEWDIETEEGLFRLVHVEDDWFLDGIYA